MSVEKIGKVEAIALILIVIINEIILNIPNTIILSTGSGVSISSIFISILAIVFTYIVCKLFKAFLGKDLLDISKYTGGKTLKTLVGILYIVLFILLSSLSTKFLSNFLKFVYFNNSPIIFILLFFLIPSLFVNILGLKSISGVNLIFIPLTIFSLIFLLVFSYSNFSVERIFPLLGNGVYDTFVTGSTNIFAFTGLAYLYFIPTMLKNAKDFKKISVISITITAIFLVFCIISLVMSFPIIATADENLSLYLLARKIRIGSFVEKFDTIFVFIWIISLLSFLSLNFFYILNIFKKITKTENSNALIPALGLIILGNCLILKDISIIKFFTRVIGKYFSLILIFGVSLIILIAANIKYKHSEANF